MIRWRGPRESAVHISHFVTRQGPLMRADSVARRLKPLMWSAILATAIITPVNQVRACRELDARGAFNFADVVFVGKVKQIFSLPAPRHEGGTPADVVLEVSSVLKGAVPRTVTVRDVGKNCRGRPKFRVGDPRFSDEYLVFATGGNDSRLETGAPFPTGSMSFLTNHYDELRRLYPPRAPQD
jgi:hypothetical protein